MNIIFVASAASPARTIALDWRHFSLALAGVLSAFIAFTLAFNFVTLRWAAAVGQPWLQAIALADQRNEARVSHERVQGHLDAMAIRVGELQAELMRLQGLGERLVKVAGVKPQEPSMRGLPGRGGPASASARSLSINEFGSILDQLSLDVQRRSAEFSALETLVVQTSTQRKFMPTQKPILDGWFSSNFGHRIDPITGQNGFHEGVDFPAEAGTPIVAAASGKVAYAGWHPQYGRLLEIDHGNGLVSRYAHARELGVGEGDLVIRGQRVASVGSSGRSTGPHLHFEVRQHGVPQNPARFLASQ